MKVNKFVIFIQALLIGSAASASEASLAAINPLTATPYVAVHNGDIVESLVFIAEYTRAHPRERAVLLLPKITKAQEAIIPAVAFTRDERVFIHSYRTGDQVVTSTPTPNLEQPAGRAALYAAFQKHLRDYTNRNARTGNPDRTLVSDENLKTVTPSAQRGDTDAIQLARAHARLRRLGVRCAIQKSHDGVPDHLVIEYDGLQFYWSRTLFSGYNGLAEKPALNGFVAGVLFASDYRTTHPSEKVALFLRDVKGKPGAVTATTLFTKGGVVFVRDPRAGDLLINLKPQDLKNRKPALAAADAAVQRAVAERRRQRLVPPPALVPSLGPDLSVNRISAELQQRKIDARLMGASSPTLIFKWAGTLYAYDGQSCSRTTKSGAVRLASNP